MNRLQKTVNNNFCKPDYVTGGTQLKAKNKEKRIKKKE